MRSHIPQAEDGRVQAAAPAFPGADPLTQFVAHRGNAAISREVLARTHGATAVLARAPAVFAKGAADGAAPSQTDRDLAKAFVDDLIDHSIAAVAKKPATPYKAADMADALLDRYDNLGMKESANMAAKVALLNAAWEAADNDKRTKAKIAMVTKKAGAAYDLLRPHIHELMEAGIDIVGAEHHGTATSGTTDSVLTPDVVSHLAIPMALNPSNFKGAGLSGGHDEGALLTFVRENPNYLLVRQKVLGDYTAYEQRFKKLNATSTFVRSPDGVYEASAAPVTDAAWITASPKKTTVKNFQSFLKDVDAGFKAWLAKQTGTGHLGTGKSARFTKTGDAPAGGQPYLEVYYDMLNAGDTPKLATAYPKIDP